MTEQEGGRSHYRVVKRVNRIYFDIMGRNRSKNRPIKKMLFSIFKIGVCVIVGLSVLLLFVQHSLIYHPSKYEPGNVNEFTSNGGVRFEFVTDEGTQVAYWFQPNATEQSSPPDSIWITYGGNASRALVWADFLKLYRGPAVGFLLIDYPGYGECEGSASPSGILDSTTGAVEQLSKHLNSDEASLRPKLAALGHSLGAAAALQAAEHYKIRSVVLISPFTSLRDMAKRVVTPIFTPLLRHTWNNRARLASLEKLEGTEIVVVHGVDDVEIPVEMSQELAALYPAMVTLYEVPDCGHNDIFYAAAEVILQPISEMSHPSP